MVKYFVLCYSLKLGHSNFLCFERAILPESQWQRVSGRVACGQGVSPRLLEEECCKDPSGGGRWSSNSGLMVEGRSFRVGGRAVLGSPEGRQGHPFSRSWWDRRAHRGGPASGLNPRQTTSMQTDSTGTSRHNSRTQPTKNQICRYAQLLALRDGVITLGRRIFHAMLSKIRNGIQL